MGIGWKMDGGGVGEEKWQGEAEPGRGRADREMDAAGSPGWGDAVMIRSEIPLSLPSSHPRERPRGRGEEGAAARVHLHQRRSGLPVRHYSGTTQPTHSYRKGEAQAGQGSAGRTPKEVTKVWKQATQQGAQKEDDRLRVFAVFFLWRRMPVLGLVASR